MPMPHKRVYTCWMLVEPAEDVEGLWVSHCLNFDVISQGDSPEAALESLREAIALTVVDDIENDLDPTERMAPPEEWAKLERAVQNGTPVKLSQLPAGAKVILALSETFVVERIDHQSAMVPMQMLSTPPTAYQPAA